MEDAANPIVADKALGGQISELAGELGSPPVVFEGSDLQKDPVLSNFLDQLSGSVKKRSVREYEGEMQQDPIKRRQRGSSEELNRGRLNLPLLRSMLEDSRHPKVWNKGDPDVKSLAESYEVDPALLRTVLRFNAVPILRGEPEGRKYGSWPSEI